MNSSIAATNSLSPFERLLGATSAYGVTPEEFRELIATVEVPTDLTGLFVVASTLLELIPLMHSTDLSHDRRALLMKTAKAIVADPDIDVQHFRSIPCEQTPTAFWGMHTNYPLYSALGYGCKNPTLRKQLMALTAAFVMAYAKWQSSTKGRLHLRSDAGRALRRLGDLTRDRSQSAPEHLQLLQSVLKMFPKKATAITEYSELFSSAASHALQWGGSEYELWVLNTMHRVFANLLPGQKSSGTGGNDGASGGTLIGAYRENIVMPSVPGGEDLIQITFGSEGDDDEGGDDDERQTKTPPRLHVLVASVEPYYTVENDWLLILANRHRTAGIALDNQAFPFSADVLSSVELCCLVHELVTRIEDKCVTAGVVHLLLAIFVGLPRALLASFKLHRSPTHDLADSPTLSLSRKAAGFRTFSAQEKNHPRSDYLAPHTNSLVITLPTPITDVVATLSPNHKIKSNASLYPEGTDPVADAKQIIEAVNDTYGTRVTLAKVEAYRYVTIINQADETAAILATGQQSDRGYEPITYTARSNQDLDHLNRRVSNHICELAGLPDEWRLHPTPRSTPIDFANTHGSKFAPAIHGLQLHVKNLQSDVANAYTGQFGFLDFVAMNIAFMTYTYQCVVVGFGLRPVCHPFPHVAHVSADGWAIVSDKDGSDFYHSRLIRLPLIVAAQLRELEVHNRIAAQRIALINWQDGTHLMRSPSPKFTGRADNLKALNDDPRWMYWLDAAGMRTAAKPLRILGDMMALGLEDNAGRHYLATRLRKLGCPELYVRLLLGHWRVGEEPHGKYSTVDPLMTKRLVETYVDPLMEEIGWKVVQTPLRFN